MAWFINTCNMSWVLHHDTYDVILVIWNVYHMNMKYIQHQIAFQYKKQKAFSRSVS